MGQKSELRKKEILEKVVRDGSLLVHELAEQFNTSETTIHRDLTELDAAGLIRKVYGGAVRIEKNNRDLKNPISNRSTQEIKAKKCIGKAAGELVHDNDIIYIDPGTTSWEMIPFLKNKRNLTIISNSVRLLLCLDDIGHHNIIQLGGTLRSDRLDTVGTLPQLGIEQLRGYTAFQGGDGLDLEFGLSALDHESALIAKIVLANARQTCILADHTKFANPPLLYRIVPLDKINFLITDQPLKSDWTQKCQSLNIKTIIAE